MNETTKTMTTAEIVAEIRALGKVKRERRAETMTKHTALWNEYHAFRDEQNAKIAELISLLETTKNANREARELKRAERFAAQEEKLAAAKAKLAAKNTDGETAEAAA